MSISLRTYVPKPRPTAPQGDQVKAYGGESGLLLSVRWSYRDKCWRYRVQFDDGTIINCGEVSVVTA